MTKLRKQQLMIAGSALVTLAIIIIGVIFLVNRQPASQPAPSAAQTGQGKHSGKPKSSVTPTATDTSTTPQLLGITQFGSNQDDTAQSIAIDNTGIYIVGETEGSLDGTNAGDESTATPGTTAEGVGAGHTFGLLDARDAFVEKYTLDGKTKLWGHQYGTAYRDDAGSVTVNSSGVYVAGETEGSLDATLQGELDVYIHKYSFDGTLLWAKQFGTSNRDENAWIASDATHVCMGGGTLGSFPGYEKQGNEDIYARCYDNAGNELWTLQFGTPGFQETLGGTLDSTGIYITGATADAIGTDPEVGSTDMWFGHISLDGKLLETHQFGSKVVDFAHGVATDDGHVYVDGRTEGKIQGQKSAGGVDAAIFAYDKNTGKQLWNDQYGTPDGDASQDVLVYPKNGNVFMIGIQNGKTVKHGEDTNEEDGFIREYTPSGSNIWMGSLASDGYDEPRDILINGDTMYVVGRTGGVLAGSQNFGAWDEFIARYDLTP